MEFNNNENLEYIQLPEKQMNAAANNPDTNPSSNKQMNPATNPSPEHMGRLPEHMKMHPHEFQQNIGDKHQDIPEGSELNLDIPKAIETQLTQNSPGTVQKKIRSQISN